jgi:hypothetical protein
MRKRRFECCSLIATDLQRAFYRIFRAVVENQRHAIAGRQFQQSLFAFLFKEFVR